MPQVGEADTPAGQLSEGAEEVFGQRFGRAEAGEVLAEGLGGIAHTLGVYANGYNPRIVDHEFQSFSDYLEIHLHN